MSNLEARTKGLTAGFVIALQVIANRLETRHPGLRDELVRDLSATAQESPPAVPEIALVLRALEAALRGKQRPDLSVVSGGLDANNPG